jgi:hypothetical protein
MCSTRDPGAQLPELLDRLDARVRDLPEAALGEELVQLRKSLDRLESVFARGLRRFDAARGYTAQGAFSLVGWLRWKCRLSPGAAAERLSLARQLPELAQTDAAFARGDLGYQHAALIARTAEQVGSEAIRAAEPILVEAAQQLDPSRFWMVTRHLRHCADPDGTLADANRDFARRHLHLSRALDGCFVLDGLLDAEGGAALQTALNALSTPMAQEARTAAQRRADALVELCRRQLDGGGLPEVGGQRPHLTVTAGEGTLAARPGQPAGDLAWGLPIPAETVRRLACDAARTRVTLTHDGQPLDVGRTTRTVPPALRRALVVRDHGCRFPGCDRPSDWTDGHHLQHWADGGATTLANLVLLCRRHHRTVHEEGWRLAWDPQGGLVALPPPRLTVALSPPPGTTIAAWPGG